MSSMQVSSGRPHMPTSYQRGLGNDPVVVLGRITSAVAVNMSIPPTHCTSTVNFCELCTFLFAAGESYGDKVPKRFVIGNHNRVGREPLSLLRVLRALCVKFRRAPPMRMAME